MQNHNICIKNSPKKDWILNLGATRKYKIYKVFYAGLVLNSFIHKQIFRYKLSLKNSFVFIKNQELFLTKYTKENIKLLLNKKEIIQIINLVNAKKYIIFPTKIYLQNYKAKIAISLGKFDRTKIKSNKNKIKLLDLKKEMNLYQS